MQQASLGRHRWGGIMGEASGCTWKHLEASGCISGRHLGGIWKTTGRYLGDIWEVSGRYLGRIWEAWAPKVSPRWSEGSEPPKSVTPFS